MCRYYGRRGLWLDARFPGRPGRRPAPPAGCRGGRCCRRSRNIRNCRLRPWMRTIKGYLPDDKKGAPGMKAVCSPLKIALISGVLFLLFFLGYAVLGDNGLLDVIRKKEHLHAIEAKNQKMESR